MLFLRPDTPLQESWQAQWWQEEKGIMLPQWTDVSLSLTDVSLSLRSHDRLLHSRSTSHHCYVSISTSALNEGHLTSNNPSMVVGCQVSNHWFNSTDTNECNTGTVRQCCNKEDKQGQYKWLSQYTVIEALCKLMTPSREQFKFLYTTQRMNLANVLTNYLSVQSVRLMYTGHWYQNKLKKNYAIKTVITPTTP